MREAAIARLLSVNLPGKRAPERGWWDLSPAPACLSNDFMALLMLLRRSSVEIVEAITTWRTALPRKASTTYTWRGDNYLLHLASGEGGEPEAAPEGGFGELEAW